VIPWQQSPDDPVVDSNGNVYFDEPSVGLIAKASAAPDRPVIVAGTGEKGLSGDGGGATSAKLNNPSGLAVDSAGNLFIADFVNNRIRRVDAKTKVITTIAGNGLPHRLNVEM
jgi:sugar lactone lactonase YvrE